MEIHVEVAFLIKLRLYKLKSDRDKPLEAGNLSMF